MSAVVVEAPFEAPPETTEFAKLRDRVEALERARGVLRAVRVRRQRSRVRTVGRRLGLVGRRTTPCQASAGAVGSTAQACSCSAMLVVPST
jgi:hypothetical protein